MTEHEQNTDMMTTREVTQYLKITRQYLHQLVKEGRIPCYRLGKKALRYKKDDIETFLALHKQPT